MSSIREYRDSAKVIDAREVKTIDQLRSMFPNYKGNQFLVVPADRRIDFEPGEVSRLNSMMILQRHGDDEW